MNSPGKSSSPSTVGIIGAGAAGLSAALELRKHGVDVEVLDAAPQAGGLASGFKDERWDWSLERYYHHWFQTDSYIRDLVRDLDAEDRLFFPRPLTAFWNRKDKRAIPFDSPSSVLKYPYLSWPAKFRFGLAGIYLRKTRSWRNLEKHTAHDWLRRWMGQEAYKKLWEPMLIGKFGRDYTRVNMAWFWARIHARTPRLGYFEGGFQALFDLALSALRDRGGSVELSWPVEKVRPRVEGGLEVLGPKGRKNYAMVLSTLSPEALRRSVPDLEGPYLEGLGKLRSLGALVWVLALRRPLLDGVYWLNLPAESPDKGQSGLPFLALVEHTHFVDPKHYGGDHIVYLGDYLPVDHPHMSMSEDELLEKFLASLRDFNPDFERSWVRKAWLSRTAYAQPIPEVGHSANIPPLRTPVSGLYWASMSQVYPWDRGTNFAVEIGIKAARQMVEDGAKLG